MIELTVSIFGWLKIVCDNPEQGKKELRKRLETIGINTDILEIDIIDCKNLLEMKGVENDTRTKENY